MLTKVNGKKGIINSNANQNGVTYRSTIEVTYIDTKSPFYENSVLKDIFEESLKGQTKVSLSTIGPDNPLKLYCQWNLYNFSKNSLTGNICGFFESYHDGEP